VQADFSAQHKFEMFHRIGDVDLLAVDAGFLQRAVKYLSGRSHERFAGKVLLVAGLLADQHHLRVLRPFAEHGLRRVFPEVAGAAAAGFVAQGAEACHGVFLSPFENIVAASQSSMRAGHEGFLRSHWDCSRKR
jgi:hypothetical protein